MSEIDIREPRPSTAAPYDPRPRGAHEGARPSRSGPVASRGIRRALGFVGIAMASPFFAWFALGLVGAVPSLVEVFGTAGLRAPASITVGGLLIAALGFHET